MAALKQFKVLLLPENKVQLAPTLPLGKTIQ